MLACVLLGGTSAGGVEALRVTRDLDATRDHHQGAYVGAAACRRCHGERYASWQKTYHRAMTAEASDVSVLGAFDGRELSYLGVSARMSRDRDGAYWLRFSAPGRATRSVQVVRTVGSHRYQQYLGREGGTYFRLPIAWQVKEARFMHMNEAFLTPDPAMPVEGAAVSWEDYDRHVVRWNDNCIFCHNVAPNPALQADGSFESHVAELGIACEACHGPGGEHEALNNDPIRRYALHLSHRRDPTIVSPRRLSAERASDVCGRCHGQRKADDIGPFLTRGDPFVPGDELAETTEPLFRDTPLGRDTHAFAPRFWADGTPRLTAYELQGLLLSPCAERGEMSCLSCHSMHEADPALQVREDALGDSACVHCHDTLPADHSQHESASASCVDCHMPRIVYGLIGAHISHRVESPDPVREARQGRPDACTLCHVDEDESWAAAEVARLWTHERAAAEPPAHDAPHSRVERALLGGDPIERAVAASALGRWPRAHPPRAEALARRVALLLTVLEGDHYPAVRTGAWRSMKALLGDAAPARLAAFDPTASVDSRADLVRALRAELGARGEAPLDAAAVARLRAQADQQAIELGE